MTPQQPGQPSGAIPQIPEEPTAASAARAVGAAAGQPVWPPAPLALAAAERMVAQALSAADVFCGHGTDNAEDEACWLVRAAAGLSVQEPLDSGLALDDAQLARIAVWLEQRINQRVPVAYLAGRAWFAGLEFEVSDQVLVPRSPMGELIQDGMSLWRLPSGAKVLDLCTGSGCIAVALAHYLADLEVWGSDIDADALAVAERNAARHRVAERCRFRRSDVFDQLPGRFDLIVSNPPYVGEAEYAALPAEYLREPSLGLKSGIDGLDLPLKILESSVDHLTPAGSLILEVGASAEALAGQLPDIPFTWLEFEHGGEGVLTATADELRDWRPAIGALLKARSQHGQ